MPLSSFAETLITVLVAAALIPLLFRVIDDSKAARQRKEDELRQQRQIIFEADLSLQNKVIEAQVEFLEHLAELLWEYQLMAIDVAYYNQYHILEQYQKASKQYLDDAGMLLGKIRGEISKSLRLCSKQTYVQLKQLYYGRLLKADQRLTRLIANPDQTGWGALQSHLVNELSEEVDKIIRLLATDFGLTGQAVSTARGVELAALPMNEVTD